MNCGRRKLQGSKSFRRECTCSPNTEAKSLAAYILEHYEEVLNCNITELAEEAGVSDASVVRFCKSVGYKGYQDFKVNAARDVLPRDKHFNPSLEQGDDPEAICRKIFASEVNVLNRTLAGIDLPLLTKVADQIRSAKNGWSFSAAAAVF